MTEARTAFCSAIVHKAAAARTAEPDQMHIQPRSSDDDVAFAHHFKTTSPAVVFLRYEFDLSVYLQRNTHQESTAREPCKKHDTIHGSSHMTCRRETQTQCSSRFNKPEPHARSPYKPIVRFRVLVYETLNPKSPRFLGLRFGVEPTSSRPLLVMASQRRSSAMVSGPWKLREMSGCQPSMFRQKSSRV